MTITARGNFWVLESLNTAYALGIDPSGLLVHSYWGPKLPHPGDYQLPAAPGFSVMEHPIQNTPQEVTTGEAGDSNERTLDGISADGALRGFALRFVSATLSEQSLDITLSDEEQQVEVTATYRTLPRFGLFERALSIRNLGARSLTLNRVFSASFALPARGAFALTHIDGRWADEFGVVRKPVDFGTFSRESRRLTTPHRSMPFFALDRAAEGEAATETTGDVWFGALNWSGNWKLLAERTRPDRTIIHLGLNDHDFAWDLEPGETFTAPAVVFGHSSQGFGAMSRAWHDYVREAVAPRPAYVPPVLYNSWMATSFAVDEASQVALAERAAAIGAELFVIDDGWFAGRNSDRAGLGDWRPDPVKFPHGLRPLAERVHQLGMKFGIWLEPEMTNPDSDLYRAHPDWVLHYPRRAATLSRHQLILNLARRDVQDHLIGAIDTLLTNNPVDFIKWDMNRNVSEPGWPSHDRDQRELWVRYVEGVYRVWGELRRRHPAIIWENCSGGGGRVDLGMMALGEQTWISDNTNAASRLDIQHGYSLVFPASTMGAWVADEPFPADISAAGSENPAHYSLDFRFHASMAGALGIGGNLLAWPDADLATARAHIARYKAMRHLIAAGDQYRLARPMHGGISAVLYVAKDKSEAMLLAFGGFSERNAAGTAIRLNGLAADRLYAIEGVDGPPLSGAAWQQRGLHLQLRNLESRLLVIRAVS